MRAQPPSSSSNVLVDDFGLFSDLEPQGSRVASSVAESKSKATRSSQLEVNERLKRPKVVHKKSQHSHSHSHHHHYHHDDDENEDDAMLNPNYEDDHGIDRDEAEQIENNHLKLTGSGLLQNGAGVGLTSASASFDDHCHVSVSIENKNRNKAIWYKLITVLLLCVMFMVGEIVGGILAKSISIQTDAAHMAADIAGFFFSILAIYVSEKGQ